jgi:type IV pilus assembly protein PilO
MNIIESINNLDPNNPGAWPLPIKLALFIIIVLGILYAGWKLDITKQREQLAVLQKTEAEQIEALKLKQRKAANLKALQEQMREIEQSFGDMVRQLPDKTEVAGLLVDISQTGLSAGLEFNLFKPKAEVPAEFYAELPIEIEVQGRYHEFGEFVSGLATLPRIVTTHDIDISKNKDDVLTMQAIAKTYRASETDVELETDAE